VSLFSGVDTLFCSYIIWFMFPFTNLSMLIVKNHASFIYIFTLLMKYSILILFNCAEVCYSMTTTATTKKVCKINILCSIIY